MALRISIKYKSDNELTTKPPHPLAPLRSGDPRHSVADGTASVWVMAALALLAMGFVGYLLWNYVSAFGWPLPEPPSRGPLPEGVSLSGLRGDWGTFGDFVGGTLNPIFAFLSFVALLLTLRSQAKQVKMAREALGLARLEQEQAKGAADAQLKLQQDVFIESVMPKLRVVFGERTAGHTFTFIVFNDGADCGTAEVEYHYEHNFADRKSPTPGAEGKSLPPLKRHDHVRLSLETPGQPTQISASLTVKVGSVGLYRYKFDYVPNKPGETGVGKVAMDSEERILNAAWLRG